MSLHTHPGAKFYIVDSDRSPVGQREDYTKVLVREGKEQHLYGVVVTGLWGVKTIHVLAQDCDSAIRQATCALTADCLPTEVQSLIKAHAERLPLVIEGWGKTQF